MSTLGDELRTARSEANRPLRAVADEAEISPAYLQKLERDRVGNPSPLILERLADVLGISYARLMKLAGYAPVSRAQTTQHGPLGTKLASTGLTETEENAVAAFIDHLIGQRKT